jgi:hypothetical protein
LVTYATIQKNFIRIKLMSNYILQVPIIAYRSLMSNMLKNDRIPLK